MTRTTEQLIKAANSSTEKDTSLNSAKRTFDSEGEAEAFFATASQSLREIDVWNRCGTASSYALFDDGGEPAGQTIQEGLFIRIELSGAGKYDWVRVTGVHERDDEAVVSVKPTFDPTRRPQERDVVSHFFSDEATNNFCLMKDGKSVSFYVIGIGEKQNVREAGGMLEAARNAVAANLGYYLGAQKAEWKMFCTKFLEIAG